MMYWVPGDRLLIDFRYGRFLFGYGSGGSPADKTLVPLLPPQCNRKIMISAVRVATMLIHTKLFRTIDNGK